MPRRRRRMSRRRVRALFALHSFVAVVVRRRRVLWRLFSLVPVSASVFLFGDQSLTLFVLALFEVHGFEASHPVFDFAPLATLVLDQKGGRIFFGRRRRRRRAVFALAVRIAVFRSVSASSIVVPSTARRRTVPRRRSRMSRHILLFMKVAAFGITNRSKNKRPPTENRTQVFGATIQGSSD